MGQKRWKKPKLVILIRGTSEEHVLEMCKAQNQTSAIGVNYKHTPADCLTPINCQPCGAAGAS